MGWHPRGGKSNDRETDPTRVMNQASLRTSSGRIWIVMGGLFVAVSIVPLVDLGVSRSGPTRAVAVVTITLMLMLYIGLLLTRFATPYGPRRLKRMATLMIATALVAVVGTVICAHFEVNV